MKRKGIILAGGTGTRLYPLTHAVSKQLMPIYDKPMIYYPLSVLMLAEIREVLVITTPEDLPQFQKLLKDGSQWGLSIEFAVQPAPDGLAQAFIIGESFLNGEPSALILGDNLFYGHELAQTVLDASKLIDTANVFGYYVSTPEKYGVIEIDKAGNVLSIEEKPTEPKSNFALPGLYFFPSDAPERAKQLKPSARGELEITDLIKTYHSEKKLSFEYLGRGTAWLDTGSHGTLLDAANFVSVIEKRQGLKIACLEEIALLQGWISKSDVENTITAMGQSEYAQYLKKRLKELQ